MQEVNPCSIFYKLQQPFVSPYLALSTAFNTIIDHSFPLETHAILLASMTPNTPGFPPLSWASLVSFVDALSIAWPLRFAPTQGSFLCHFLSPLDILFHTVASVTTQAPRTLSIYSSRAKLQTRISDRLLETLLGFSKLSQTQYVKSLVDDYFLSLIHI